MALTRKVEHIGEITISQPGVLSIPLRLTVTDDEVGYDGFVYDTFIIRKVGMPIHPDRIAKVTAEFKSRIDKYIATKAEVKDTTEVNKAITAIEDGLVV